MRRPAWTGGGNRRTRSRSGRRSGAGAAGGAGLSEGGAVARPRNGTDHAYIERRGGRHEPARGKRADGDLRRDGSARGRGLASPRGEAARSALAGNELTDP